MLKYFLISISLFVISCTQHKIIKNTHKTEKISVSDNSNKEIATVYIFYRDYSKESLLIESLSDRFNSLNYKVINVPSSQLNLFKKYYKNSKNNIFLSLGNSLYDLDKILNYNYKYFIIDTPNIKGKIPINLIPKKTLIITDSETIKYIYPILNNRKYKIDLKFDKFAWFLNPNNSLNYIFKLEKKTSKLLFKQNKNNIIFNKNLNNNLLIIFTQKLSILKKCNKICQINEGSLVQSVYIPINKPYYISKDYIMESKIIKNIFKLINEKEYLNTYLLMNENKNIINYKKYKKIFDFIKEPLYNSEPDLKGDKNGKYK